MGILVILEQRGELRDCALEAASAASALAKQSGKELDAILIGKSLESQYDKLTGLGIKKKEKRKHKESGNSRPLQRSTR